MHCMPCSKQRLKRLWIALPTSAAAAAAAAAAVVVVIAAAAATATAAVVVIAAAAGLCNLLLFGVAVVVVVVRTGSCACATCNAAGDAGVMLPLLCTTALVARGGGVGVGGV